MKSATSPNPHRQFLREFALVALGYLIILGWLFHQSLHPAFCTFSNDTPLGLIKAAFRADWMLAGNWYDLNWLGISGPAQPFDPTTVFMNGTKALPDGALLYSKFFAAFSLFFVAMSFWACLKMWRFASPICAIGGLAALLHGDFFPNSCWGVGTQVVCFGLNFLAIGLLADESRKTRWVSVALAGFAVGMGVAEGYDIGALFSLVVAAFTIWMEMNRGGSYLINLLTGVGRLVLVAGCAGLIAASALTSLVGTQIIGVVNMGQDEASKARRWEEATMWSTPPVETVGVLVPALFGFRMDTPQGGEYWGRGGRVEAWDRYLAEGPLRPGDIVRVQAPGSATLAQPRQFLVGNDGKLTDGNGVPLLGAENVSFAGLSHQAAEAAAKSALEKTGATSVSFQVELPRGFIKYGGGGGYAGAIVLVLAAFAVFQSFRRNDSAFTSFQRRMVWFWFAVAVISLLLSYGRFAPFYQLFYSLPYASTMRIPGKFGHILAWATLILFAFGAQALWVRYVASVPATTRGLFDQWRAWWTKAGIAERRWIFGSALAVVLILSGWTVYAMNRGQVETYIAKLNFYEAITQGQQPDAEAAATEAKAQMNFSLRQAAKAVGFFAASFGLVAVCLSGYFAGGRSKIAAGLAAVLILAELGPASIPWVVTYNWKEKYLDAGNNAVIDFLRQRPHENRVAILSGSLPVNLGNLEPVYGGDWKQHLFQYYNIQTIDIVQMPRVPTEVQRWEGALRFTGAPDLHVVWRRWQLMNTRYLLGGAGMAEALNQQLKPNAPFRELMRFDFYQTRSGGPVFTRTNAQAQFALIEYTGALPRAKLYASWQVSTNDDTTLKTLRSVEFDPAATVLVAEPVTAPADTNATPGTVEFASYAPKRISLKAKATAPSVLLLNDKYDPNWKVSVDGQPTPLLRCNYVMRGVLLPAGDHLVEFRYAPPMGMLYVSLAASATLVALLGFLIWARVRASGESAKR